MIESTRTRWERHEARMEQMGFIKKIGWKHEVKRLLRRHTQRVEDNIKMDLMEIRWEGVDWIDLAQDRDR
jgi:hypothetical protein